MSKRTAIIIGAGPAGLTAAYKLLKETDIKPIVLEDSAFIGGISRTAVYHKNRMDIGGHRFFSKNDEVMKFWEELMPIQGKEAQDDKLLGREKPLSKGGPDPEADDNVMLIRTRVSRIFYLRKFFDYPISLKFQTFKNMGFARTMKAGFGVLGTTIKKRKVNSLEDFYINRFGKPLYEMFFEDYTTKLWGVHPSKIAPDWGAQRVKGLSLWGVVAAAIKKPFVRKKDVDQKHVETSLIEQYYYPKKGPGQLWELLAQKIKELGGEIRTNCHVDHLDTQQNRVTGVSYTDANQNRHSLSADYVISSMPVKDLVAGMDDAPQDVRHIADHLPYRDFITVGLLLNKLKIQNETSMKTVGGIVPDCWIYIQERDVKLGRLQIFNNWSPYMVDDFEHKVWVGLEYFCNEGDEMWNASDDDFIHFAIDELAKIDIIDKEDVLDSTRINVKKAYPAYFGTYAEFDKVRSFLDGYENLFCVGRNGQHRYNNMDHSMMTAFETVRAIQSGSTDKSDIWNVNTEESYHEEK